MVLRERQRVPDGSATAKALDYSLKRWQTLTRYIDDGDLPADTDAADGHQGFLPIRRFNSPISADQGHPGARAS
jgi:transposase